MEVVTHVWESPLGRTTMSMCRPARLAGFVDHIWHSDGVIMDRRERILPDGTLGLVLALGAEHRRVDARTGARTIPAVSVAGLWTRPFVLEHSATCDTIGIVLRPAGAYALLARDLSELSDVMIAGDDLLGAAATELAERCADTPAVRDRFALVQAWITARLAGSRVPDPAIAWIAAEIERHGGDVRVGDLREETGLSKARAVGGFRRQIGVSPKVYARLVRFRRTLQRLREPDVRLTDVALDAGYYDQAHMDAEFRELGGVCPTEFLATRFADGSGNSAREPG